MAGVKRMGEESWGEKRMQGSFQTIGTAHWDVLKSM